MARSPPQRLIAPPASLRPRYEPATRSTPTAPLSRDTTTPIPLAPIHHAAHQRPRATTDRGRRTHLNPQPTPFRSSPVNHATALSILAARPSAHPKYPANPRANTHRPRLDAAGHTHLAGALHAAASGAFVDDLSAGCLVAGGVALAGAIMAALLLPAQPVATLAEQAPAESSSAEPSPAGLPTARPQSAAAVSD